MIGFLNLSNTKSLPCRSLQNKIVRLGLRDDKFLYGNYLGQDRLFSYPYSYLIPKASPLKGSKDTLQ